MTEPLRVARAGDLIGLLHLAEAFYREDGFSTSADELAANLELLLHSDAAHVVVAQHEADLVGFAITTTSFSLENGLIAELEDLYIDPAHRRRGRAEQLLQDAVDWAGRCGAAHLEVVTAPNGQDVSHLNAYYEARGFIDEGRQIRTHPLR